MPNPEKDFFSLPPGMTTEFISPDLSQAYANLAPLVTETYAYLDSGKVEEAMRSLWKARKVIEFASSLVVLTKQEDRTKGKTEILQCPYCNEKKSRVIETRKETVQGEQTAFRIRRCDGCKEQYRTKEIVDQKIKISRRKKTKENIPTNNTTNTENHEPTSL